MLDAVLPPTLTRCAQRLSSIFIALGLMVAILFPATSVAGTEVAADRYVTGGLLVAAGIILRFLPRATVAIVLVLGAVQFAVGGAWVAVLSIPCALYAGISWWRGRGAGESGPSGGAVEEDGADPRRPVTTADVVYENVEAVVMALLIALTVREFLYEAFQIPTASMYPTIYGEKPKEGREHGDRLLASKVGLLVGDPPRWSIVVFKYPLYRRVNFIKRLVGLPGEQMELRAGDVYINGECMAKPERVQDQLWFAEYPSPGQERTLSSSFQPMKNVGAGAGNDVDWQLTDGSAKADAPAGTETRLVYGERLGREDTDLRIGADIDVARLAGDGAILLRVEGAGRRVELAVSDDGAVLTAPGIGAQPIDDLRLGDGARVTLGVADRVARVWLDGRLVARVPHKDIENGGNKRSGASLGLRGAAAAFSDVRIDRDLQYGKSRAWDIPDDGFIMLGDNTGSSKDSREWRVNVVTMADGRQFAGEQDVKLEDNSSVRFRDDGENYTFIDVDGVLRRIPVEGTTIDRGVRRPFVRRRDLVGRAFVTFYPFPPFGNEFRPHFLP